MASLQQVIQKITSPKTPQYQIDAETARVLTMRGWTVTQREMELNGQGGLTVFYAEKPEGK